jgi:nucleotide-binding universal stress UspA family protein
MHEPAARHTTAGPTTGHRDCGRELEGGPVVVASDGARESDAAMRIATRLAVVRGLHAEVVSVLPVVPFSPASMHASLPPGAVDALEDVRRERRLREVARQMETSAGVVARWPVTLEHGEPARLITEFAERRAASLIVTGLRAHGRIERMLEGDTALEVMRRSAVPVLSVLPTLEALPRRAVIAVDFSRASLRAARAALAVLAPDARLLLVHVRPGEVQADEVHEGYGVIYSHGVVGAFARIRRELQVPPGMRVETVFLQGEPVPELRALVHRAAADLIGIGSHRHGLFERLRLGSVTAALARQAPCSMLVTPPTREQR